MKRGLLEEKIRKKGKEKRRRNRTLGREKWATKRMTSNRCD